MNNNNYDARAPGCVRPSAASDRTVNCPFPTVLRDYSAVHFSCAPRVRGACSPSVDVRTRRDNTAARVSNIRPAIDIFSINAVSTLGRSNLTSTLACFSFGRSTTCRQNRTIYSFKPFKPFRFLRSSHALAAGPGTDGSNVCSRKTFKILLTDVQVISHLI
jgi:hypothetical protein